MKILVADDEPLIRRSLEKILSRQGHQVILAEDGSQAVRLWRESHPDIVILDVLMPGLTGPEVIMEVHDQRAVPVVLISAYSADYDPDSIKQLGAVLFIAKPFEDLNQVTKQILSLAEPKQ